MTLDDYCKMRMPESRWRRDARRTILAVVERASPDVLADRKVLLKRVDAAYPFGRRERHPYKAWLTERQLFIGALNGAAALPTADEVGVCEVARDLVELGRDDEARRLVEEQAPHRLARKCPACNAPVGQPCRHADATAPGTGFKGDAGAKWPRCTHCGRHAGDHTADRFCPPPTIRELIVPHHARLVGHLGNGPLFGATP